MFATVLVLLSDEAEARRIGEALQDAGFDPIVASSGSAARALIPDAVVVDRPDAFDASSFDATRPIPVLGLGGAPGHETLERPFTRQQLTGAVARLVGVRGAVLALSDRTVDLNDRTVRTADGEQSLTPREAELLQYLAEHPHRVVPSDEIISAVWGKAGASTLSVTLRRLRQKIEVDPNRPTHLKTVHAVGVQLLLPQGTPRRAAPPPRPSDPLVGREALVSEVVTLLEEGDRAVALVGPPGVGKSRVALEVADRVPWPVVWSPDGTLDAVHAALDLPAPEADPADQIRGVLIDAGPLLLVLDDADRVDPTFVADWVGAAPRLHVLLTARRAPSLGRRIEVAPLSVDDATTLLERHAGQGEARLEEVARALDGLPLALELAGPMVGLLGAERVIQRMSGTGALDDAIRSSWALLDDGQRDALTRLSCMAHPFPIEAAEAVLGDDALRRLSSLVAASLVQRRGPGEFVLLRTIRAFVHGAGSTDRRAQAARDFHAWLVPHVRDLTVEEIGPWVPSLLDAHAQAVDAADADTALAVLDVTHNWLGQRGGRVRYRAAIDATLPLGGTPARRVKVLLHRGTLALPETAAARPYFTEALQLARDAHDHDGQSHALARLAESHLYAGDQSAAVAGYDEALAHCRRHAPLPIEGLVRIGHAHALLSAGRTDDAEAACLDALDVLVAEEHASDRANVLVLLAAVLDRTGRGPQADGMAREALRIARAQGDIAATGRFLSNIGAGLVGRGRTRAARAALEEALELRLAIGHAAGVARVRGNLATLFVRTGELPRAVDEVTRARRSFEALGDRQGEALCRVVLGHIRLLEGRTTEARHLLTGVRTDLLALGEVASAAAAARLLAWLEVLDGDVDAALQYIAVAAEAFDAARAEPGRVAVEDLALLLEADRGLDVSARATHWADRARTAGLLDSEVRLRTQAAHALAATGRGAEADAALDRARAVLADIDDPPAAARVALAAAFLERVKGDGSAARALLSAGPGDIIDTAGEPAFSPEVQLARARLESA